MQAFGNACADIHRLGKLPLKNGLLTQLLKDSHGLPGAVPELLKAVKEKAAQMPAAVIEAPLVVAKVAVLDPPKAKAKSIFTLAPRPAADKPVVAEAQFAVAQVADAQVIDTGVEQPELSPDEQLILASREEKESTASKFSFTIDWQRWKPAMQGAAFIAGLIVVVVVGWPRVGPAVNRLYVGLTGGASQPPAQIAVPEPAAPVVEEPVVTEPAPAVAETPLPAEPEPVQVAVTTPAPAAPAASAPAATPPAPALPARIPGPTVTNGSADELELVIRDWLMAWQDQDVDNFFSYYHTDFAPLYQNTLTDWRSDRQSKISRPASIMIELEDFTVGPTSPLGTKVSFWMTYETPNYADRTLKEVLIGPDLDGQWRILQEYNQEVAQVDPATFRAGLALNQQAPAPQASGSQGPQRTQTSGSQGPQRTRITTSALPLSAFPGTVQPPAVSSRGTFSQDQIDEIARFLAAWLTAWQNQDADDYFRYYMPGYKASSMASAEEWRTDRITKINRPARIVLRMDDLQILAGDDDSVRVQLVLEYHSTHYADRTLKEIELRKAESGAWLITMEKNKEVEALPLMRLFPVDSLAFLF